MGRFQESNGRLGEPSLPCKWQGCLSEATVVLTARSSNSLMEMVSGSQLITDYFPTTGYAPLLTKS
jgi:hypothetical protein